ncbi:GntR family transcriptional regulator [Streptomyces sp. JJ66]|uniref:GntR family transcriptional regulator n=1 Tax=Streptomyces sp. JJ66 TaxID=2803843 RepID=UPI001C56F9C2|nr:GntR family transcriptional regulator [Streptomyces sp. JJ66]MBW1603569.1 GntR family transcriptional regulator [Streptomyces sp. JJ66]
MTASRIVADIRQGIADGQYRHGTRLPSVRDLADQYGVSQQTAAAAYAVLAALGLARSERGSGTTVAAGPAADAYLGTYTPPDLDAPGAQAWRATNEGATATEETTLVRQIVATDEMAEWGIPSGSDVVERTRIRSLEGIPVQHKITVVPYDLASRRPEGYEGVPPMLAPVGAAPMKPPRGTRVADWLGWDVQKTDCAITAEPMAADACTALLMPEGSPGFRVVNVSRDGADSVVYATVTTAPLHHRVTMEIIG